MLTSKPETKGWSFPQSRPRAWRRRFLRALVGLMVVVIATIAWWTLTTPLRPGEEAGLAWYEWAPRKLKTLAVNAIGERIRLYIREKVEDVTFKTDLTPEQMQKRILDDGSDSIERRHDAYRLAK